MLRHKESLQAKQRGLMQQLDLLDQECEQLRSSLAEEEEKQYIMKEHLEKVQGEQRDIHIQLEAQQTLTERMRQEKLSLEQSTSDLQRTISELGELVQEMKERERLLVSFPDLHIPVEAQFRDILEDMGKQLQANNIRISILEEENSRLRTAVAKMKETAQQEAPKAPGHPLNSQVGKPRGVTVLKTANSCSLVGLPVPWLPSRICASTGKVVTAVCRAWQCQQRRSLPSLGCLSLTGRSSFPSLCCLRSCGCRLLQNLVMKSRGCTTPQGEEASLWYPWCRKDVRMGQEWRWPILHLLCGLAPFTGILWELVSRELCRGLPPIPVREAQPTTELRVATALADTALPPEGLQVASSQSHLPEGLPRKLHSPLPVRIQLPTSTSGQKGETWPWATRPIAPGTTRNKSPERNKCRRLPRSSLGFHHAGVVLVAKRSPVIGLHGSSLPPLVQHSC
uniref:Coiled-coil domain-containing protein 157 n=1 Tax=Varanus komodoensis TaxID=61221 RepID=A0A8D2ILG8_VARKO